MKIKPMIQLPLATLLAFAGTGAQAAGSLCRYDTGKFATLDSKGLGKCVTLRSEGAASGSSPTVWELTTSMRFATQCPLQSITLEDHPGTACSKVAASAMHAGDSVRVDEWGNGRYQLVIQRNGRSAFHTSQGPVLLEPVEVVLDGQKRKIGYRADNVMVDAATPTDPPVPVSYYVYLRTAVQDDHYIRWYDIEVFSDDTDCRKEIPGSEEAATAIVDCPVATRVGKVVAPMQFPAGGGGEDPPG